MVAIGTDTFIEMLRRSRLVDNDQLEKALAEIQRDGGAQGADDPRALSDKLIAAKLITPWQRDQLLQGRYKGFFIVGDKYKLLGLLGTGGMSSVYLASQVKMNRLVAIKHLPKNRVSDSSYLARFYREAEAAAKLDHKNIVRAIDIDHEKDNHFFIMEYVEGRDLQSLVRESGPLEYDAAADYIRQAAEGLEHAHQAGLLHRDIKPANLLVNPHGVVKVLDMGLARWEQDDKTASLTIAHEENVLGTADYLPPEQARDSHSVDKRADIYSLGCTLYFVLTGHPPFPDGTLAQRVWKHQNQMPESIFNDRKDAPSDLVEVCMRMMAKQPDARFQSAGEVAQMLGKWLDKRSKPDAGGGVGFGRRLVGPPPRRSPLGRSGAFPITPPRRSDKPANDDTVSNMQHDTIKGVPGKGPSQSSTGQSQVKYGSGVLGPQGSSSGRGSGSVAARGGSSILGLGGSSILGKAGASGKGPGKSSSKSLPVAKSLDGPKGQGEAAKSALQKSLSASQAAKIVRDDTLGNLIDQAVREVKVAAPHLDQASGAQPALKMAAKPGSAIPSGVWLVIGGAVAIAVVVGLLFRLF